MLSSSRHPAVRVRRRRETLRWPTLLSLALHLTLLLLLLIVPPRQQPVTSATEPLSVEIFAEGSAEAATEAPAPLIASASPVQQAEIPPPTPATAPTNTATLALNVPPPLVQQAETPPATPVPAPDVTPPPVQQAETPPATPAPAPDVPSPPVQQAETLPATPAPAPDVPPPPPVPQAAILPVMPAPAPMPALPPSVAAAHPRQPRPVASPRPLPAPPQRVAARPTAGRGAPANPADTPAQATGEQNAASRANNGAAWMGKLKQWWDQHSFYPMQASQTNEGGTVKVRIVIAADGQVTSIEVVQGSGSIVLDVAAVAVFRNAHLPPFPAGTPAQPADVVVTLHYRPANHGG